MTLKQFINEAMGMAQIFLKRGDHENYSKMMGIIADATATANGF